MGLAGPRKRVKISHDPNNTTWARATDGFGHKIMTSQGWTPGSFLGARNASHAASFTAASASHIRVSLKDDTLGLGARPKGMGNDEPTGLDAFQGLLGRLNGKSDAKLEEEQRKRDEIRLARYAQQKWQTVRFVSAGYLAQEKSDIFPDNKNTINDKTKTETSSLPTNKEDTKPDQDSSATEGKVSSSEKKKKKSKDKSKKKDRKKKEKRKASSDLSATETPAVVESSKSSDEEMSQKAVPSREQRPMGRHAIRGRHIQQKKKALMDDRSLNEIFMIKT